MNKPQPALNDSFCIQDKREGEMAFLEKPVKIVLTPI